MPWLLSGSARTDLELVFLMLALVLFSFVLPCCRAGSEWCGFASALCLRAVGFYPWTWFFPSPSRGQFMH